MKFLSFKHNDRTSYGVKVKREDAVWDLTLVFADLRKVIFIQNIISRFTTKPNVRFPRTST